MYLHSIVSLNVLPLTIPTQITNPNQNYTATNKNECYFATRTPFTKRHNNYKTHTSTKTVVPSLETVVTSLEEKENPRDSDRGANKTY